MCTPHRPSLFSVVVAALLLCTAVAHAYVEIPYTLGRLVQESSHVMLLKVEKVDKTKNLIVYRKVKDIKGVHPAEVIRHNIGQAGFSAKEWQTIMAWAEPGKTAIFMHNGSASETCIDGYWYQAYSNGEWWGMSHGEPYMNRSFTGKPDKLGTLVQTMLTGQEVITTCMVDGDKAALQAGTAKVQRLKASMKIQDYNPQRDFLGWGGNEDFRRVMGMPGFTHLCELPRVDPGAAGIAPIDFDGDGKMDFCLFGESRTCLLQNDGKALNEFSLPYQDGARSAAWADYNGDGKPDLLLATALGPKLLTNQGESFHDDTAALPLDGYYNLSGAVWADANSDDRPDVVLADGFLGWRVYRNLGPEAPPKPLERAVGKWHYAGPFDNTNRNGFDTKYPPEVNVDMKAEYTGKGGAKIKWKVGDFGDGKVNSLNLFSDNNNCTCYIYREYNVAGSVDIPASFGSDDTLQVWFNGQKIVSVNTDRGCTPDSDKATLKFKPGKNKLLLKIGQGSGDFAFYFKADVPPEAVPPLFADATSKLAPVQNANATGQLFAADLNGDGVSDLLLTGKEPLLALATPQGFKPVTGHGLQLDESSGRPAIGDIDGDKLADIFIPSRTGGRLYRNAGKGKFVDVTEKSGELSRNFGWGSSATWADLDNRGQAGLLIGCLQGPNRFFRLAPGGKFTEATEELGLQHKVFNTQAVSVVDLNNDGALDVLFNNEAQVSTALLGNKERVAAIPGKLTREK